MTVKKAPPVKKTPATKEEKELPSEVKVIHKVSEKEFIVSRNYYLENKGSLNLA